MKRKLMIVINPKAGVASGHDAKSAILAEAGKLRYSENGVEIPYILDVRETRHAGHANELAHEAVENEYYGVLACGGDGTVNEVARGVCGSSVALGIIPLGSGNGLARHLGIPMTITGAMKVIAEDRLLAADYATANNRPFFCTFGVGFDAEVSEKFNRTPGRGLKNYIRTAFDEYLSYRSSTYTIIANGERITEKAMIVAVCNASQYGNNAYIAPQASIKDGLLDITVVHTGNIFENAAAVFDVLTGMVGKTATCTTFQASSLRIIRNSDGAVHFDGEAASLDHVIDITCHHAKLNIFSTEKKSKLRAALSPQIPFISPLILTMRDIRFKIWNFLFE